MSERAAASAGKGSGEKDKVAPIEFGHGPRPWSQAKDVLVRGRRVAVLGAAGSRADACRGRGQAIGIHLAGQDAILSAAGCDTRKNCEDNRQPTEFQVPSHSFLPACPLGILTSAYAQISARNRHPDDFRSGSW